MKSKPITTIFKDISAVIDGSHLMSLKRNSSRRQCYFYRYVIGKPRELLAVVRNTLAEASLNALTLPLSSSQYLVSAEIVSLKNLNAVVGFSTADAKFNQ